MSSSDETAARLFNGQVELVQLALDFVGPSASDIYVYASAENNSYAYYALFGFGDEILMTHQIEGKSSEDMSAFLVHGCKLLDLFIERCRSSGDPVPTEFKIHYQADLGELSSSLGYDPVWSLSDTLTSADMYRAWKEEVISTSGR